MSTDGPRSRRRPARRRVFAASFALVLVGLVALGAGGAAASGLQGPRITAASVDPAAAAAASGSRLIVTTTQSLHKLSPAQIEVTPAAPFTVDTSGRSIGVRFMLPLHDQTTYTVRFRGVTGLGGGPTATFEQTFRTPALHVYVLRRGSGTDSIVRTSLDGGGAVTVYRNPHIEDFRATDSHLVVSVQNADDSSRLVVTDLDGRHERALKLPGTGVVASLQSADRGELIGYTYSENSADGLHSALFTASLKDDAKSATPTRVRFPGTDQSALDWRFVPDTSSILVLTFGGRAILADASGKGATDLGTGTAIDGIARGSSVAVIDRPDGRYQIDLTNAKQKPLVAAAGATGYPAVVTPIPGPGAGTIRPFTLTDYRGPGATTVYRVSEAGAATKLTTVPATDSVLQTCVSPSGRYAAVLVAPDVVDNPYNPSYLLPMREKLLTRIVDIDTGRQVGALDGFDISWCQAPPMVM